MTQIMIFAKRIKEYTKQDTAQQNSLATLYAVIWGQCSKAMGTKLKFLKDYEKKLAKNKCLWALLQIHTVTMKFDSHTHPFLSVLDAKTNFLACKQGEGQTADIFLTTLKGWAVNVDYLPGNRDGTSPRLSRMEQHTARHCASCLRTNIFWPHNLCKGQTTVGKEPSSPTWPTSTPFGTTIT